MLTNVRVIAEKSTKPRRPCDELECFKEHCSKVVFGIEGFRARNSRERKWRRGLGSEERNHHYGETVFRFYSVRDFLRLFFSFLF